MLAAFSITDEVRKVIETATADLLFVDAYLEELFAIPTARLKGVTVSC
jgi:hypothetical protein